MLKSENSFNKNLLNGYCKIWEENARVSDFKSNVILFTDIIRDARVSEHDLINFIKRERITTNGGFAREGAIVEAFNQRFNKTMSEVCFCLPKHLAEASKLWLLNAHKDNRAENKKILLTIVENEKLPDIYAFVMSRHFSPDGNFLKDDDICSAFLRKFKMLPSHFVSNSLEEFMNKMEVIEASIVIEKQFQEGDNSTMKVETRLQKIDTEYNHLVQNVRQICSTFPPRIPEMKFSDAEAEELASAIDGITAFTQTFAKKYAEDFTQRGQIWHGRTSYQRMLWQNEEFLSLMSKPVNVKAILYMATQNKEERLLGGNTLSALMLYGINSNCLSYLISASPNWREHPSSFKNLVTMSVFKYTSTSREVQLETIEKFKSALNSFGKAIEPMAAIIEDPHLSDIKTKISNASFEDLLKTISAIVYDDKRIAAIANCDAGNANVLANECFDVMSNYQSLLQLHENNLAQILGYPIISHALDGRHLLAAIHYLERPISKSPDQAVFELGKSNVSSILLSAKEGKFDLTAQTLLKVRLQQIMAIIIEKHKDAGITLDEINKSLQ